jgi:hypothetical protein
MLHPRIERGSLSAGVASPTVGAAATGPLGKLLVESEAGEKPMIGMVFPN